MKFYNLSYNTPTHRNFDEVVAVANRKEVIAKLAAKTRHGFKVGDNQSNILSLTEITPSQVTLQQLSVVEFLAIQGIDFHATPLRVFRVIYDTATFIVQEAILLIEPQTSIEYALAAKSQCGYDPRDPASQITRTDELHPEKMKLHELSVSEFHALKAAAESLTQLTGSGTFYQ